MPGSQRNFAFATVPQGAVQYFVQCGTPIETLGDPRTPRLEPEMGSRVLGHGWPSETERPGREASQHGEERMLPRQRLGSQHAPSGAHSVYHVRSDRTYENKSGEREREKALAEVVWNR